MHGIFAAVLLLIPHFEDSCEGKLTMQLEQDGHALAGMRYSIHIADDRRARRMGRLVAEGRSDGDGQLELFGVACDDYVIALPAIADTRALLVLPWSDTRPQVWLVIR